MRGNKNILLNDIVNYSGTYSKMILDEYGNKDIYGNNGTIEDMLARLGYLVKKLKASTVIPYVLFVVNKNSSASIDTLLILKYLESYLIRRSLTDLSADNFNKFFREVLIAKDVLTLQDLKTELSETNNRTTDMPSNNTIKARLASLDYDGDNETPKALLYMYELELCKANKSQTMPLAPDCYTLEHLMPQTLTDTYWPGPNQDADHIYKLGNMGLLTQSLQSILKNRSWSEKLNGFSGYPGIKSCCHGLYTMSGVVCQSTWNNLTIDDRTNSLVDNILNIWKA